MTRVSIVVNNYNYAEYLPAAIESSLAQYWPDVETVVVDDGSTDGSRAVLERYSGRIIPVLQENSGQAAAFRAGLSASSGEVVVFLDSDDLLLPTAASAAVHAFQRCPAAVKVSWPLWKIDAAGRRPGGLHPDGRLPRGDLASVVLEQGVNSYLSPPTSGNAWARPFLERVLPAPEQDFRRGGDGYLITLAPLFGLVEAVRSPQGCYRLHGQNGYWKPSLEERVAGALERYEARARALTSVLETLDLASTAVPVANDYILWLRRVSRAVEIVRRSVPVGRTFLLVDGGEWGDRLLADRPHTSFPERDGVYWGPPADDAAAQAELSRHVAAGVRSVVVGWPAFWWLEAYPSLAAAFRPVRRTDDVLVAEVTSGTHWGAT